MTDSRLRQLERALATSPSVGLLHQLDAARRRVGDGPWLPVRVSDSWRWDADAFIRLRLRAAGEGVGLTDRVPRVVLHEWFGRIAEAVRRGDRLPIVPKLRKGGITWPIRHTWQAL